MKPEQNKKTLSWLPKCEEFLQDQSGAIAVYVGLIAFVLAGVGALTLDLGRLFVTGTETQSYVDAAALAGAYQLDGKDGARARATEAINDKLFTNQQTMGALGSDDENHSITINTITFFSDLTGDVVATSDREANFVQVAAQSTSIDNALVGFLGGPDSSRAVRAATAGNNQVICEIPPLMMCNPQELATGNTTFSVGRGQQYIAKYTGPGAGMVPGTFGLLDSPTCGQGSRCIADLLAHINPASGCYSSTVDIRPGQANGIRQALNTRFDMYEQPYFKAKKNDYNYHAASNVTKGFIQDGPGNNACPAVRKYDPATDPIESEAIAFPRDDCLADGSCERLGDGVWDRQKYWDVNHPSFPSPFDLTSTSTVSRYEMYQWEIENNQIPNNSGAPNNGENGNATCNAPDSGETADRRTFVMAVVNCLAENVHGNTDDVEVVSYIEVFLTESVGLPSDAGTCVNGNPNGDPDDDPDLSTCLNGQNKKMEFVVEMIRELEPGGVNGELHDMVQLFR